MIVICHLRNNICVFHLLPESNKIEIHWRFIQYSLRSGCSSKRRLCVLFVQATEYKVMERELILLVNNHMTIRGGWRERGALSL